MSLSERLVARLEGAAGWVAPNSRAASTRGGPPDDEACRAIGGFGAIDGGPARDGGYSLGGGGDIPSRRAEGVLVAYDDRDGDGQLDLCSDATCTDRILGASNPAAPFLHREVVHQDPDGYLGWSLLDDAYPEVARSLLYVEEAWKPYGVREIPAGYAVWRMDADVAAGERFLDAFDPTIDIEVPVVDSPVLDQLACEGGCDVRFAYGSPDCPDLETTWCTLRPQLPPAGVVWVSGGGCADGQCIVGWQRLTIEGCTRRLETWYSCPTPPEEAPLIDGYWNLDPSAWDWSCVESP